MKNYKFSRYLHSILATLDLTIIVFLSSLFFSSKSFFIGQTLSHLISWLLISLWLRFYKINRNNYTVQILNKLIRQFIIYSLAVLAFYGATDLSILANCGFDFIKLNIIMITVRVFLTVYLLKAYRSSGHNYRNLIVVGYDKSTKHLVNFFHDNRSKGYRFLGYFSNKNIENKLGNFEDCYEYLKSKELDLDEVYISTESFPENQLKELVQLIERKYIKARFIPIDKMRFNNQFSLEYYNYLPILSFKDLKIHEPFLMVIKRIFDIVFSSLVIIFILSWLYPIVAYLIKKESDGPVIFKQKRVGQKANLFWCYKFRSMAVNTDSDTKQATKNDMRITKIGAFLRKTSLDEFPQFINVFRGEMSIVGPRPHMISHDDEFTKKHHRYLSRHQVKPGITGLAQTTGFRGEIESDHDIRSRTKMDLFYIENWTILLDVKIIIDTVLNVIKGEKKAY